MHIFKTCLQTLTLRWPRLWCHTLEFKENVETNEQNEVKLCLTQVENTIELQQLTTLRSSICSGIMQ